MNVTGDNGQSNIVWMQSASTGDGQKNVLLAVPTGGDGSFLLQSASNSSYCLHTTCNADCVDRQPPSHWDHPTCASQLANGKCPQRVALADGATGASLMKLPVLRLQQGACAGDSGPAADGAGRVYAQHVVLAVLNADPSSAYACFRFDDGAAQFSAPVAYGASFHFVANATSGVAVAAKSVDGAGDA